MHVQVQYILLLLYIACTCAVYSTFLNASTDTVSNAVGDQKFLGRGRGQNPEMKIFVNNRYNL